MYIHVCTFSRDVIYTNLTINELPTYVHHMARHVGMELKFVVGFSIVKYVYKAIMNISISQENLWCFNRVIIWLW